ncbi:hypothetical protein ABXV20_14765 [Bacillus paranthracis]|nr:MULTISPECIES: hypothetical protein [Bacillus cereus group]MCC2356554.1 hypothetical protein [Bacillus paranthracis]MDX5872983.1 hypothetical protein [Bacillus cereus group sp. BfR-BA-01344]
MSIALVAGTSFSMELKEKNIVEEHPPYNSPSKLSREKYQLYNNQNNVLI